MAVDTAADSLLGMAADNPGQTAADRAAHIAEYRSFVPDCSSVAAGKAAPVVEDYSNSESSPCFPFKNYRVTP